MAALLKADGFTLVSSPKNAEVLIVNTCGFIAPARDESISTLQKLSARKNPVRCSLLLAAFHSAVENNSFPLSQALMAFWVLADGWTS